MRKVLLWFGVTLYVVGVALILANVVMSYLGLVARFNFGDLTQSRFWPPTGTSDWRSLLWEGCV